MILNPLNSQPAINAPAVFTLISAGTPVNWHRVAAACVVATLAGCAFMGVTCLVMS